MLYTSLAFAYFYGLVLLCFYVLAPRYRVLVLLLASYFFYAYTNYWHLGILLFVTIATFLAGIRLGENRRKGFLAFSIAIILSSLLVFKYYNFLLNLTGARGIDSPLQLPNLGIILPIGISFYTFQAVSYLVDVYQGRVEAEKRLSVLALYLAFFPQILAGPIERAGHLIKQFYHFSKPSFGEVLYGLKMILWGFFCKLVIADKMALIVDTVYGDYTHQSSWSILLAIYLYSFQIYFDFYGYTNISIGLARLFGIRLSFNFNNPYLARSLKDFWRRWHITLSFWFRDYLYIPLGGSEVNRTRFYSNILIVFVLSGLWHGAALNFVLWGLLHGVLYLLGVSTKRFRNRIARLMGLTKRRSFYLTLKISVTFTIVSFTWLVFRVEDFTVMQGVVERLFALEGRTVVGRTISIFQQTDTLLYLFLLVTFFTLQSTGFVYHVITQVPTTWRQIVVEVILIDILLISLFLVGDIGSKEFIYFRF